MDELAADLGVVVDEDDRAPRPGCGVGGGETRRPGADHEQVATRVDPWIVGWRTMIRIDAPESGHGANRAFISLPARPEERLVVEPRGQERRELVDKSGAIAGGRRRRVDRAHGEIVLERFRRRPQVRRRCSVPRHVDDRVRLFRPRAPDSARAVVFEAAADNPDAIGDERRGDAVAHDAGIGLAVEGEGKRLTAIDAAAGGQTKAAQGSGLVAASLPTAALTAVSRVMTNISMQVRCSQISRAWPLALSLNHKYSAHSSSLTAAAGSGRAFGSPT